MSSTTSSPDIEQILEVCSNVSGSSTSPLISGDGGNTKEKEKNGYGDREINSFHSMKRLDSGVDVDTPPMMSQQKEGKYASVISSSRPQPPIPVDTTVQYQEIDIRATHVS